MSASVKSNDWQCVGVATLGGASGVGGAYGYSLVYITSGIFDRLFVNQYIGGWGIG